MATSKEYLVVIPKTWWKWSDGCWRSTPRTDQMQPICWKSLFYGCGLKIVKLERKWRNSNVKKNRWKNANNTCDKNCKASPNNKNRTQSPSTTTNTKIAPTREKSRRWGLPPTVTNSNYDFCIQLLIVDPDYLLWVWGLRDQGFNIDNDVAIFMEL